MKTVSIRKQGGAAIMTIPPDILKALHVDVGSVLSLEVQDGAFVAQPVTPVIRKRYSLKDLLSQCDSSAPILKDITEWDNMAPVGAEVI